LKEVVFLQEAGIRGAEGSKPMVTREQLAFARRQVREVLGTTEFKPSSLEERIQLLEDRDAIRNLIGHYAVCIDAQEWDELFKIFTDDVVRLLVAQGHVVNGKDALRKVMTGRAVPIPGGQHELPEEGLAENKHLITTEVIRIASDRKVAYAACVYQLAMATEEHGQWDRGLHEGRYILTFGREGEQWKISKLEVLSNIAKNRTVENSCS
jgi:ketosteroid isomerase-like protein